MRLLSLLLLLVLATAAAAVELNGNVWGFNSATSAYEGTGGTIVYYGLNTQLNSGTQTTTLGANATTAGSTQGTATGNFAAATGNQASAYGFNAQAPAAGATALGSGSLCVGVNSVCMGAAKALQTNIVVAGQGAVASFQLSVVMGFNANDGTGGAPSTVIGPNAIGQSFSTTVGELAHCGSTADVCMGYAASTSTTGEYGIAVGTFAQAFGPFSTAVGVQTQANADSCSVFGIEATCSTTGDHATGVGREANVAASFATCVGTYCAVLANNGVCMGNNCLVNVPGGVAVGAGANSQIAGSIALGPAAGPLDAAHAFALVLNTASLVSQGLGITLNGVAQQIPLRPAALLLQTPTTGTTTLTGASAPLQWFTASHTVILPMASTLQSGTEYTIVNLSTGNISVETSGFVPFATLARNTSTRYVCNNPAAGTGTASWTALGPVGAVA